MSDTSPLADLVPGSAVDVEAALTWLKLLGYRLNELNRKLRRLLNAEHCPEDRPGAQADVSTAAFAAMEWLAKRGYTGAVSADVVARVGPFMNRAIKACFQIASFTSRDTLEPEKLAGPLATLRSAHDELRDLMSLLAAAKAVELRKQNRPEESVDEEDLAILRAMAERPTYLLILDQIASRTKPRVSSRTVGRRLKALIAAGWAVRPKGEKRGARITTPGLALLKQYSTVAP